MKEIKKYAKRVIHSCNKKPETNFYFRTASAHSKVKKKYTFTFYNPNFMIQHLKLVRILIYTHIRRKKRMIYISFTSLNSGET